jgi:hypothetical protein
MEGFDERIFAPGLAASHATASKFDVPAGISHPASTMEGERHDNTNSCIDRFALPWYSRGIRLCAAGSGVRRYRCRFGATGSAL